MPNILVQMSRKALTFNYKAQRGILQDLRDSGHVVPKLNASKSVFTDFFLTTLNSYNEYEQLRLGVDSTTLKSQHATALWSSTKDNDEPLDSELTASAKACLDYDFLTFTNTQLK